MPTDKTLYFPVWVSTRGRTSLRWGPPCDTAHAAKAHGKAEVLAGNASLAFVVEVRGGVKTPMWGGTYPESARKIIGHWEALWDVTESE